MANGRGFLLILNVQRGRPGSDVDTKYMSSIFQAMGAEVHVQLNPSRAQITNILINIKKKDFTNYAYAAVAYFSHGFEDNLVQTVSDDELINIEYLILTSLGNIHSLNGKLKWLIFQTCRGSSGFQMKDIMYFSSKTMKAQVSPIKYPQYYAKFYATSPGMVSYRCENGSLFIRSLCKRLHREYKNLDIISIMENVKADVMKKCRENPNFTSIQIPAAEHNFSGKRFFISSGFR